MAFDHIKPEPVVQNKGGGILLLSSNSLRIILIMKTHLQVDQNPVVDPIQVDQSLAPDLNHRLSLLQNNHRKQKVSQKQNLNP